MCFVFGYLVRKSMFQEMASNPLAYAARVSSSYMSVIPHVGSAVRRRRGDDPRS